jgi:hypothetical protein
MSKHGRISAVSITVALFLLSVASAMAGVITGTVSNNETGDPIPFATVSVEGTAASVLTNDQGQYRLRLTSGDYSLKFSHVAHFSVVRQIAVVDSLTTLDVALEGSVIELPGVKVYERAYDPAQAIIVEAIRRKQEILSGLRSYRCQAYVKGVLHKQITSDSGEINLIMESQLECLWQQPDRYKEIIKARRQTKNVPELVFLNVDKIPNFNMNRIAYGQYSIVSPVAEDALKYYNYYLLDTVFIDGKTVFRLEVEPKNTTDPLVQGTIDIADSSFAVVGVEGGFGPGMYVPMQSDFRYSQRFLLYENKYWMPNEIHMTSTMNLAFPVEVQLTFEYVAALADYEFDVELEKGDFAYALEIAEDADDYDSTQWNVGQSILLTDEEHDAYRRIDSIAAAPKPLLTRVMTDVLIPLMRIDPRIFHFNRVEGAYLGYGHHWLGPTPRMQTELKVGYAFSRKLWQFRGAAFYRLTDKPSLWVGFGYYNEIRSRPTILNSREFNPTSWNLFGKTDPLDYYHEEDLVSSVKIGVTNKTDLTVMYRDARERSETNTTEYSIFARGKDYRENPAIRDGTNRSFQARISYDSRPRYKIKGRDYTGILSSLYTKLTIGAEIASPKLIDNDFDYFRYYLHVRHAGRTVFPGVTTVEVYAGGSDRDLPPQRYFTVDFTYDLLGEGMFYRTVGERNFSGNRVAAWYASNNFGAWFFRKSGLPLIKELPLSVILYGGMFWTDFHNHLSSPGDEEMSTASRPYSEIGFGIGRIPPLSSKLTFTWQLSHYDTRRFSWGFGFEF